MVERKVPYLEDWVTPGLAAKMLGVSKQAVHNLMEAGKFDSLHRVNADGDRPFYVLRGNEVEKMTQARKKKSEETLEKDLTEGN